MYVVTSSSLADQLAALDELEHDLIPYAVSTALTKTAQGVMGAVQDRMRTVFDRPTPYTLSSLRLQPATKDKLTARVWFKNEADGAQPASVWLSPEVYGGPRRNKPAELQLRAKGILPPGMYMVPGKGAELDRYGNMKRGQITKVLSGVKGFTQAGYQANATNSKRSKRKGNAQRYFVMRRGSTPIGIAERTGKGRDDVAMVMAFVGKPGYGERLDFFEVAQQYAQQHLPIEFEKAMETVRRRFAARARR